MTDTDLTERLERLERAYQRMKRLALAALVLIAALGTIAATQPVAQKITAYEFDVIDSSGKVRMTMEALLGGPAFHMYDEQGKSRAEMAVLPGGDTFFSLNDARDQNHVGIGVWSDGSPLISLKDAQGFVMDLGHTALATPRTGASQKTSAASIVMFSNDKKGSVIWKAP